MSDMQESQQGQERAEPEAERAVGEAGAPAAQAPATRSRARPATKPSASKQRPAKPAGAATQPAAPQPTMPPAEQVIAAALAGQAGPAAQPEPLAAQAPPAAETQPQAPLPAPSSAFVGQAAPAGAPAYEQAAVDPEGPQAAAQARQRPARNGELGDIEVRGVAEIRGQFISGGVVRVDYDALPVNREICPAELRVVAFARRDENDTDLPSDDDERIPGVRVSVIPVVAAGDPAAGQRSLIVGSDDGEVDQFIDAITGAAGEIGAEPIEPGTYQILVEAEGYEAPLFWLSVDDGPLDTLDSQLTIGEDQRLALFVGLVPLEAKVTLRAFWDRVGAHGTTVRTQLGSLPVDLFDDEQRIACVETGEKGFFAHALRLARPTLIGVRPRQSVRVKGHLLQATIDRPIFIQAGPGTAHVIDVVYTLAQGAIRVSACVEHELDGVVVHETLHGVTFALYAGPDTSGPVLRQQTHSAGAAVIFDQLPVEGEHGTYTIEARGPSHFRGQRIELTRPAGRLHTIQLAAGETHQAEDLFCFTPCAGHAVGMVVDGSCGKGISDIAVLIKPRDPRGRSQVVHSGQGGFFTVEAPVGEYEAFVETAGTGWQPAGFNRFPLTITASGTSRLPDLTLLPDEEEHIIRGTATLNNRVLRNALIDILDVNFKPAAQTVTDSEGRFSVEVAQAGIYYVRFKDQMHKVEVNSVVEQIFPFGGTDGIAAAAEAGVAAAVAASAARPLNGALGEAASDLASYPVLTSEVSAVSAPTPAAGGGGSGLNIGQTVEGALREVLAWRPRATDPKGFLAALNQSFSCEEKEGRSICSWTPRSYAVQVDLGAITGAQASIYTRAKAAVDQAIPLLDGLYALLPDADREDTEAIRAIVRSNLTELVAELGVQGGPRVARVDSYFDALLGAPDLTPTDIADLTALSQLGRMRDLFGFDRLRVNTIAEEQDLTNFIILVDHTSSLRRSWIAQRSFFDRSGTAEPFFGTQSILLARSLAVVVEGVDEASFAMDSVFIDNGERQTIELTYSDAPPIFVGELLRWVHDFAGTEAPRLIQDGGKEGALAITPTLARLQSLTQGALLSSLGGQQNPANFPAGYRTSRVQRALQELAGHLQDAHDLAAEIVRGVGADSSTPTGALALAGARAALPNSATEQRLARVEALLSRLGLNV